jgi:hypothetical protein
MSYTPINTDSYTNAFAGAIAGMAVSGWIVDPTSINYAHVAAIAGAFAEAFDTVWNDATALNSLQTQAIQSVCQEQFAGHAPGSLDNASFTSAANWAVPAAACAALVLEGDAYVASQGITPTTPGGSFGPIQNVRFYDAAFAGTPNGSIAAPFTTFEAFYTEVGDSAEAWELTLPGRAVVPDVAMPDLNSSGVIVFSGVSVDITNINLMHIDTQSGTPGIVFKEIDITLLQLSAGTINFELENCFVEAVTVGGTLEGSVRLTNCQVTDTAWGEFGNFEVIARNSTMNGNCSFGQGQFWNVEFGAGTTLTPGGAIIQFTGCKFNAGITIDNDNNPTIEMDPVSYYWYLANNVTFAGDIRLTPVTPVIGHVLVPATNVAGGATSTIDCGDPVGTVKAEAGSRVVAQWATNPGNVGFSIQGATVDAGTGHIMLIVANNTGATHGVTNNTEVNIVYAPREQAL